MCRKIGILGGTFDPFHKGHFMLAKTAYEQFQLDEVWIMPNGNPPHKKNIEQTDFKIRCEMILLAIKDTPYMNLCSVEGSEDCYHYTYQTLELFRSKYPADQFYFIIGADSLNDFPTWREPGKITQLCTLLVASRDEDGIEQLQEKITEMKTLYGGEFLIMNSPKVDAASKEIRKKAANFEDISRYLDASVDCYIRQYGLYQNTASEVIND